MNLSELVEKNLGMKTDVQTGSGWYFRLEDAAQDLGRALNGAPSAAASRAWMEGCRSELSESYGAYLEARPGAKFGEFLVSHFANQAQTLLGVPGSAPIDPEYAQRVLKTAREALRMYASQSI